MPDAAEKDETYSPMVRWLIGLSVAGIAAVGAWVGSALRDSTARDDKMREYLQQEIDKGRTERVELSKAITGMADSSKALTKAIESQTAVIERKFDTLIQDTRKGVWLDRDEKEAKQ
jgi:adenylylsulfate kinase-like enzyme